MQHYRAPTRLLDWTDAALVALYFALSSWSPAGGDARREARPAVWALNPWALNRRSGYRGPVGADFPGVIRYLPASYTSRRRIPPYPLAIDPDFAAQRMLVQHSHFTIHGCDTRGIDQMKELTLAGITETTVFPDLEGLASELKNEYQIR